MSDSVLAIYKVGIGPSSSHTIGPMCAAHAFVTELIHTGLIDSTTKLTADLYGSLALTGRGHLTDMAVIMGFAGYLPATIDVQHIPHFLAALAQSHRLEINAGAYVVDFDPEKQLTLRRESLPLHENGMVFTAYNRDAQVLTKTYYSVGGGKIVAASEFAAHKIQEKAAHPYPFSSAKRLLAHCHEQHCFIADIILANELVAHTQTHIETYFEQIAAVMREAIIRGASTQGVLPGPLKVPRRAHSLYRNIRRSMAQAGGPDPLLFMDWVNLYALAVSEENAAGGRIVTAPTNGACGIVPAVLAYFDQHITPLTLEHKMTFFLTSGAIGLLFQENASISGAEVGCQGEVGVACSMAAAGFAALMNASPDQVCIAAEIAMEHHLGLTCDPVGGQVQIPCIERNAIAALKAINAARMALRRTSLGIITLDDVIKTMYETGKDMDKRYRETAQGGLAITMLNRCG